MNCHAVLNRRYCASCRMNFFSRCEAGPEFKTPLTDVRGSGEGLIAAGAGLLQRLDTGAVEGMGHVFVQNVVDLFKRQRIAIRWAAWRMNGTRAGGKSSFLAMATAAFATPFEWLYVNGDLASTIWAKARQTAFDIGRANERHGRDRGRTIYHCAQ